MHAIAHGSCTDTVAESALKVHSGKKTTTTNPYRTGGSNLPQRRAGQTLHQLSFIPTCRGSHPFRHLRAHTSNILWRLGAILSSGTGSGPVAYQGAYPPDCGRVSIFPALQSPCRPRWRGGNIARACVINSGIH